MPANKTPADRSAALIFACIAASLAAFILGAALVERRRVETSLAEVVHQLDLVEAALRAERATGRVVIVGGSFARWGLGVETLEAAWARPVISVASIGSFSYQNAYLRRVLDNVQAGDTLMFTPGDLLRDADPAIRAADDPALRAIIARFAPKDARLEIGSVETQANLLDFLFVRPSAPIARSLFRISQGGASPLGLPGERRCGLHHAYKEFAPPPRNLDAVRPYLARMEAFAREAAARGARLHIVMPWVLIDARDHPGWRTHVSRIVAALETVAPVLPASVAATLQTDPDLFCGDAYHIGDAGSLRFTQMLIAGASEAGLLTSKSHVAAEAKP